MGFTAYRYYSQRKFQPNQIASCFEKLISELGLASDAFKFSGNFRVDDDVEESKDLSIMDLRTVCEIKAPLKTVSFSFADPGEKSGKSNIVFLATFRDVLQLGLILSGAEKSEKIFKTIQDSLQLDTTQVPEYRDQTALAIEERLRILEQKLAGDKNQLTCFLSYRFNSRSKALSLELTRFLQLLGVNVVTGGGYEPRRIDQKVRARLEQPLDFVVYLITKEGESTWTRDELTYSHAKGYALVLLVESGTQIEKGLLGDWEYLEFKGDHIGDAFVGILEALHYIKREKSSDQTLGETE